MYILYIYIWIIDIGNWLKQAVLVYLQGIQDFPCAGGNQRVTCMSTHNRKSFRFPPFHFLDNMVFTCCICFASMIVSLVSHWNRLKTPKFCRLAGLLLPRFGSFSQMLWTGKCAEWSKGWEGILRLATGWFILDVGLHILKWFCITVFFSSR